MTCCIALAVAIGLVRTAWLALTGRSASVTSFAPVARRRAPGTIESEANSSDPIEVLAPQVERGRARLSLALRACATGVAVYAIAVFVAVESEVAIVIAAPNVWIGRTLGYAAIAAVALFAAGALAPRSESRFGSRESASLMFLAGGLTWFELGVVDSELLELFRFGACTCCSWKGTVFLGIGLATALGGFGFVRARVSHPATAPEAPR